jgi:hypothetical protein
VKIALRLLATIIGIVGSIVALIVSISASVIKDATGNHNQAHGFVGLLLVVISFIGALIAVPFPVTAALLMLIGGLGMIYVAGFGAIIGAPLLLIAAALAYMDRAKTSTAS